MENHSQSKKIQCHYCSSNFPTKLALKHHIEVCITKIELLQHTRTRGRDSNNTVDVNTCKDINTDTTAINTASTVSTIDATDKAEKQQG